MIVASISHSNGRTKAGRLARCAPSRMGGVTCAPTGQPRLRRAPANTPAEHAHAGCCSRAIASSEQDQGTLPALSPRGSHSIASRSARTIRSLHGAYLQASSRDRFPGVLPLRPLDGVGQLLAMPRINLLTVSRPESSRGLSDKPLAEPAKAIGDIASFRPILTKRNHALQVEMSQHFTLGIICQPRMIVLHAQKY